MSEEIYAPGQAEVLFKFWPDKADWFIVGGPADGNEAQTIHERYPKVKCIGFEPNPVMFYKQSVLDFPGQLHRYALWSHSTELRLNTPKEGDNADRMSSVCRNFRDKSILCSHKVSGRSLDSLSAELGPFTNMVLWLDIEFAELQALRGAVDLLQRGQILLVNLEAFANTLPGIECYLAQYGLQEVDRWNGGITEGRYDVVFKKERL